MTFGETKDWGASDDEARAILARFVDAGGTTLDTAPNYAGGASEEIVGRFIAGSRDRFVIGSKYTARPDPHVTTTGNGRKAMVRSVDASLRRLGTDYLDILWLHYWDGTAPLDEILRGFDDLVTQGKVLHVGLSDTPAWLVSRAATIAELRNLTPVVGIQAEYNLIARSAERELLPMADAFGLGAFCWGPLAAGALAGGTAPRRRAASVLPTELVALSTAAKEIAIEAGLSPATAALGWLLRHRRWRGLFPIIGARTAEQLASLVTAVDVELPHDLFHRLDALVKIERGFPHDLIASSYLRRLASGGDPALIVLPDRRRS